MEVGIFKMKERGYYGERSSRERQRETVEEEKGMGSRALMGLALDKDWHLTLEKEGRKAGWGQDSGTPVYMGACWGRRQLWRVY